MNNLNKDILLGTAIGDALGVPVEFEYRQELEKNPVIGTYSGAYPFTFRQPIKHKIAFKSTILYPFIP